MSSYCVKCKSFTANEMEEPFEAKNGRQMMRSICTTCKCRKCCIMKKGAVVVAPVKKAKRAKKVKEVVEVAPVVEEVAEEAANSE